MCFYERERVESVKCILHGLGCRLRFVVVGFPLCVCVYARMCTFPLPFSNVSDEKVKQGNVSTKPSLFFFPVFGLPPTVERAPSSLVYLSKNVRVVALILLILPFVSSNHTLIFSVCFFACACALFLSRCILNSCSVFSLSTLNLSLSSPRPVAFSI